VKVNTLAKELFVSGYSLFCAIAAIYYLVVSLRSAPAEVGYEATTVAQSEHATTHEAWATTTATLRMFIDICLHKLQPTTEGATNHWIIASCCAYLWLLFEHACVRTYVRHMGYRLIRTLLEARIQSTPVGAGICMLANTATYVMTTTRALSLFWMTTDPPSAAN
jgi:hypothetical protein